MRSTAFRFLQRITLVLAGCFPTQIGWAQTAASPEATVLAILFDLHPEDNSPALIRLTPNRWGAVQLMGLLSLGNVSSGPVSTKQIEIIAVDDNEGSNGESATSQKRACKYKVILFNEHDSPVNVVEFDFSRADFRITPEPFSVGPIPAGSTVMISGSGKPLYKSHFIEMQNGEVKTEDKNTWEYRPASSGDRAQIAYNYFTQAFCSNF
jgi:hypothetical protein